VSGHPDAPDEFSQVRYLRAKESVDDRALHRPTFDRVRRAATADDRDRLRVFEAGPGAGATLRRLLAWDLPSETTYLGVDTDATAVAAARDRVSDLAREAGYGVGDGDATVDDPLRLTDGDRTVAVRFAVGDALDRAPDRAADLVVGAAFLDLFDADRALSRLLAALAPDGFAYFPITFDGETAFLPEAPGHDRVVDAFHATMDAPGRAGASESGRALLRAAASDAEVVAAGGSDWLVTPPYPADEAYFLHHLVDVVERAVTRRESEGEPAAARVPEAVAREWAGATHAAVARGETTYLAHQLDVLVRAPPADP
jgi:SAM-dependent methyltransferase